MLQDPSVVPAVPHCQHSRASVLLVSVARAALTVSLSLVTLCLVRASQYSLEIMLVTTKYNVNSARIFFLQPCAFPFPFGDRLVFQLGWDTQITLSPFASSRCGCSAQGLPKHPP